MQIITADAAGANILSLMEDVSLTHEPILITGNKNNSILISESDWRSIQETLYLSSIPGMVESIKAGSKEPIEECVTLDKLEW